MANITMNAKDAISAKLAECFVTIENRRYLFHTAKIQIKRAFELPQIICSCQQNEC